MKVWCENLFSPRRTPSMCTHQAQLSVFLICGWIIILSKISHHCLCAWWMHIKGPQYLVRKNVRFFQEQKNTSKNLAGHRFGNLAQMCIVGTYTALLDSLRKVYYRGIQNKTKQKQVLELMVFFGGVFSLWKKTNFFEHQVLRSLDILVHRPVRGFNFWTKVSSVFVKVDNENESKILENAIWFFVKPFFHWSFFTLCQNQQKNGILQNGVFKVYLTEIFKITNFER